ncbi:phage integrase family protein [Cupriavidus agavae]|uniref:Putative integrase protein n=1 Tax=Cupriavidus agavae TaxID=1001822 RepID=A0A4Q7RH25_9BURK|nr:phage integrase family protein [Cupriavidus agavae]RZT31808.1 putative integrase protein [Cupriavidus agavae]
MAEDRDTLTATKLTRTEFAVVRAYAQGMRPVDIANRYLLDPDDDGDLTEHQAIQRILALRDRLVQFALQHDRPDIAEMFEALRGRSDAGMSRRVEALSSIEQLGQGRPLPAHPVTLWFGPSLARRLTDAGIHTVHDLVALANRRGSSWWRHVPRVGRRSADTIVRWLRSRADGAGIALRMGVNSPARKEAIKTLSPLRLSAGMPYPVPLEFMLGVPSSSDELQWVKDWLQAKAGSRNTWLSYRRESERLLLWSARSGKSLVQWTGPDLDAYEAFLADPQPAAFWCGPAVPREQMDWRPFEGPMKESSRAASLRVARVLLKEIRRRAGIPDRAIAVARAASEAATPSPHALAETEASTRFPVIEFIDWLGQEAPGPRQRAALATALLVARHGLRIVELATLRLSDTTASGTTGRLTLPAKSAARRKPIDLEPDVWEALLDHWADRALGADGAAEGGLEWAAEWGAEGAPAAALIAPADFPDTARGRAKRAAPSAGYSASGFDQLLRAYWKRFAAAQPDVPAGFSPRRLKMG